MQCIEIDDDGPHQPPPERALWRAVLATFQEDLNQAVADLRSANMMQRVCIISAIDNMIDELVFPWCSDMCDFAQVDYDDFCDAMLKKVQGIK